MKKQNLPRRNFLKQTSTSLAAVSLSGIPLVACSTNKQAIENKSVSKDWTIQEVMDLIIQEIPGGKLEQNGGHHQNWQMLLTK